MNKQGWCDFFDAKKEFIADFKFCVRTIDEAIEKCKKNLEYLHAVDGVIYFDNKTVVRIKK